MSVPVIKFSEFVNGGELKNDNITVGLESGANTYFNNPWTFLPPGTTGDRPDTSNPDIYYRLRFNTQLQEYEFYDPVTMAWYQLASSGSFFWNIITTTSEAMVSQNGYITNNASRVILTLPTLSTVGDEIAVTGMGAGGWEIDQAANQQIHIGSVSTTVGVVGNIQSTNQYNSLKLVCIVDNLVWTTVGGPQGMLSIN